MEHRILLVIAIGLLQFLLLAATLTYRRLTTILDPKRPKRCRTRGQERTHLLIMLGSGGHSAEMIGMLERAVREQNKRTRLDFSDYGYRTWVVSRGDLISAQRAEEFEEMVEGLQKERIDVNGKIEHGKKTNHRVVTVPRARKIHQSLLTAPISCLRCMIACWTLLCPFTAGSQAVDFPDLILCNGPATATILVFTSILLRFFDVRGCNSKGKMRTVYIESWARVKKLSLSGRLMVQVVDRFFVQWPQLLWRVRNKGEYAGVFV